MRGARKSSSSLGKTQMMLDTERFMHPGRITPKLLPISDLDLSDRATNKVSSPCADEKPGVGT